MTKVSQISANTVIRRVEVMSSNNQGNLRTFYINKWVPKSREEKRQSKNKSTATES